MVIPDLFIFLSLMLQAFDILVSINTGFYLKGLLIENHWVIMKSYIKRKLIFDILSTVLIIIYLYVFNVSYNSHSRAILLLSLLKLLKFKRVIKNIKDRWNLSSRS